MAIILIAQVVIVSAVKPSDELVKIQRNGLKARNGNKNKINRRKKMKKIINGKRYDTNTAKLIGSTGYSYPGDFEYWKESLYLKKTGEFFLHGEGGSLSIYSRSTGNNEWSSGEKIRPLSPKEARDWSEKYLDADEYERVFGKIEEGKCQIATWIANSLKADADQLREKGYTLANIFEAGIRF